MQPSLSIQFTSYLYIVSGYINIHSHHAPEPGTTTISSLYKNFNAIQPGNYYSVALHPWHISDTSATMNDVREAAAKQEVLAIGECGLDKVVPTPITLQTDIFIQHIHLANTLQKPLIIHCVRAYTEVLALLAVNKPLVPVIFHGFNKKAAVAEQLLKDGHYLSFGAAILAKGSPAAEVLKTTPANQFFLETDDAAVSITDIYIKAGQLRNTATDALILQVKGNFNKVFGI